MSISHFGEGTVELSSDYGGTGTGMEDIAKDLATLIPTLREVYVRIGYEGQGFRKLYRIERSGTRIVGEDPVLHELHLSEQPMTWVTNESDSESIRRVRAWFDLTLV